MNNMSNERPSVAAFIIIPTRLTIDTLNALCGLANALPNAMPNAISQPPALPAIRPEPTSSAQASNPVEAHAPTAPQPASDGIPYASREPYSEKQFGLIKVIEKKENLTDVDVCREVGISNFDELTKKQASTFIKRHSPV